MECNMKINFEETQWRGINCIDLDQDRGSYRASANRVINLRVQKNAGNFLTSRGGINSHTLRKI
jgi:hypothetical protein